MNTKKTGRIVLIAFIALAIVAGVSFLPLEKWTDGRIKNFSLISDILPDSLLPETSGSSVEAIDPALLKAEEDAKNVASRLDDQGNPLYTDTILAEPKPAKVGELVVIEDYTDGEVGLYRFKKALGEDRLARIAVIGDSYIEGDIFTQDLRAKLQTEHGGSGTGYVNMHSDFPGFRRSVKQGGNGWKEFAAGKKADPKFTGISEHYFIPTGNALSTYQGTSQVANVDKWNRSRFLFISPESTTVLTKTNGDWVEHKITGSPKVQEIRLDEPTTEFNVKVANNKFKGLGVWLDSDKGVALDCMSNRGFSGITLAGLDVDLCRQMGKFVDYDLIILEFGINAMSGKQTKYNVYSDRMVEVINHVRQCYPNADILLMGIGDRGEKRGGVVHSMSTAPFMVSAQRDAARRAHCLFWDTREAMGGEDAIVTWSQNGMANKDYIHLTHKGGEQLATLMYNAMSEILK